ncbi:MAG TPA: amino acid ABC transporter permease [Hyphomicrobiaceae bacterium]|nr:amino acid ABC transporter permease [Hyphomicrobiaceae bacterium]
MASRADTLSQPPVRAKPAEPSFLNRREVRQALYQIALVVALVAFFYFIVTNAAENLRRQNIASGFDFLDRVSGFDVSQNLISFSNTDSYGRAFIVGLLNTIVIAVIGIVLATILGFIAGIARLSKNWLIARIAGLYVETVRNMPLLLLLLIIYFGVLKPLPGPRQSLNFADSVFLNVRGLYMPRPEWLAGSGIFLASIAVALIAAFVVARWAHARQMRTGEQFPTGWTALALVVGLPALTFLATGRPLAFDYPKLQGFNFTGGMVVQPEFMALLIGLTIYTGSFIAEIVRAGIQGVPKGQWEAARAIGLHGGQVLRLVIIPQAARIIIPPLTSQYLNLTKNSSLAVAIGYPDLVNVGGTILNQTGQAVEVILMIMAVYLTLSLLTSAFMNWFNTRMALVER